MQGMGGSLTDNNPIITSAFRTALVHQGIVALGLLAVALLARTALTTTPGRFSTGPGGTSLPEPTARRVLRVSFGTLWILDGILQAQHSMPLGLPAQVVNPVASASPAWVQHLVAHGVATWLRHPVPAAAASVWIQIGIGALLLMAPRGRWSQWAGILSVGWGLGVWIFGEAFGGIFAPGASWMFGAPGAVLLYCVAGAAVALPEAAWEGRRLGRRLLAVAGIFFLSMAVLQAWPGRGSWQGPSNHGGGALTAMVKQMAGTPQPAALSSLLDSFARFTTDHGWAVNLFVVACLGFVGIAFLSGRRRLAAPGLIVLTVLSVADWVLVQDLGFLGGVGTDPNSMVPTVLVAGAAYLAFARPASAVAPAPLTTAEPASVRPGPSPAESSRAELPSAAPVAAAPVAAAPSRPVMMALGLTSTLSLLGVFLVGAVPLAMASTNFHTDAVISEALNGQPQRTDSPAAAFDLVDQQGARVTLDSLRGRTVALTFLDPVCTTDCPLIAQQFRQVDADLAEPRTTAFVAVVANPVYRTPAFTQAFDRQEHLDGIANWYFVTGSLTQLASVWRSYGIEIQTVGAGGMVAHADTAFVIDADGRLRSVLGSDPGGNTSTSASLASVLDQEMRAVMRGSP